MSDILKLSIIIPTFNGKLLLQPCIPVLLQSLHGIHHEIVVVDNASTDGTGEWILKQYPEVQYRYLPNNTGFVGACNAGALVAKGEYLLFLNNDCIVNKDTIHNLLQFLVKDNTITATQPVVKKINGETEHIGFWIDTSIGKAHPITSKKEYEQICEKGLLYGLSGTCLLIKKQVFEKVGLFNKSFHSYLEDVDLAVTLFEQGYKVKPCFNAEVTHAHMATSSTMGNYKQKQDIINWWRIILRHPKIFKITFDILIERLKNINGFIKTFFIK